MIRSDNDDARNDSYSDQCQNNDEPPGFPKRRRNHNLDRRTFLIPHTIIIGGYHPEGILTRTKIGIRYTAVYRLDPFILKTLQDIAIAIHFRLPITECRKLQRKYIL